MFTKCDGFVFRRSTGTSLEASVLPGLGRAAGDAGAETLRAAYALRPDVSAIVSAVLRDGVAAVPHEPRKPFRIQTQSRPREQIALVANEGLAL